METPPQPPAWPIFQNTAPHDGITRLPDPPSWRTYKARVADELLFSPPRQLEATHRVVKQGSTYQASLKEIQLVNAALFLRRPLLITGKPGTGKSSLAYAVAYELGLGNVLTWPVTSSSTLEGALYRYDALGRLHESQRTQQDIDIGQYITLGPLGTALLPCKLPQLLLIDEIDKSNVDLPNDLLHIFEQGEYTISELDRVRARQPQVLVHTELSGVDARIQEGRVHCTTFPVVLITSNGERELPPAFLRRCVRLDIDQPDEEKLKKIVEAKFGPAQGELLTSRLEMLATFLKLRQGGDLATDQLLNAIYLTLQGASLDARLDDKETLIQAVLKYLNAQELA